MSPIPEVSALVNALRLLLQQTWQWSLPQQFDLHSATGMQRTCEELRIDDICMVTSTLVKGCAMQRHCP